MTIRDNLFKKSTKCCKSIQSVAGKGNLTIRNYNYQNLFIRIKKRWILVVIAFNWYERYLFQAAENINTKTKYLKARGFIPFYGACRDLGHIKYVSVLVSSRQFSAVLD